MTPRRRAASLFLSLCCAAVALPGVAAAQSTPPPQPHSEVAPAQSESYLLVTDVGDGRALFVNPAGLARGIEASLGGFITARDSSSGVRVSQFGALIAARGAAFGWQHDRFPGGSSGNTYVLGLGLGSERFSLGGDHKWYAGAARGGSWDAAAHLRYAFLDLAAVWRNIASPSVRRATGDTTLEEALVAGAAIDVARRARLSGEWRVATSGFPTRYARAGLTLLAGRGVLFSTNATFSSNRALRSLTFAVQMHAPRFRAALFAREPSLPEDATELGAAVSSVTPAPAGWNRHPRP